MQGKEVLEQGREGEGGGGEVGEEGGVGGRRAAEGQGEGFNLGVRCPCPGSEQSGRDGSATPFPFFLSALAFFVFF